MCYSNIIMDKDSIETPPTPQGATPPQSEVPQSQDEAAKPQDSTTKRRWLARFVDRLAWWQATAITAGIFALPPVAVAGVIDKGVPLNGFSVFIMVHHLILLFHSVFARHTTVKSSVCTDVCYILCHEAKRLGHPEAHDASRANRLYIFSCPAVCAAGVVTCLCRCI